MPPGTSPKATPPLAKPVSAELGNVTPFVVVPGRWAGGALS